MQSLVIRFHKELIPGYGYTITLPLTYESEDKFLADYQMYCVTVINDLAGFLKLGLLPKHATSLEILSLEEWFWKYKQ